MTNTVKSHLYKLYKKLGVHRRSDAMKVVRMSNRINDDTDGPLRR